MNNIQVWTVRSVQLRLLQYETVLLDGTGVKMFYENDSSFRFKTTLGVSLPCS